MNVEVTGRARELAAEDHSVPAPAPLPSRPSSVSGDESGRPLQPDSIRDDDPHLGILATAATVMLSGAAAAWMAGGLFRGWEGRPVAFLGLLVGVGVVALSYRSSRPSTIQYLVVPIALVAAAGVLFAGAGEASMGQLPGLVSDAIRAGGLGQPPVPFDPGWRFIMVVFFTILGAGSTSLALGLNRVSFGVFLPVPALFAGGLIHPKDGSLVAGVVALVLLMGSLALAYGAELAQQEATSGQFELRRLARAGAIAAAVAALMMLLSRAGFLFPEPERSFSTPPKKPTAEAIAADQILFRVQSQQPGPWRIGVLDVYDKSLLLPPFDRKRLQDLPRDGKVPGAIQRGPTTRTTFTLVDVNGREIPNLPNTQRATFKGFEIAYDTRTQVFRLPDQSARTDMTYTIEAPSPPTEEELAGAPPPPPALADFTVAPPPPGPVADLLATAPTTSLWERLSFVRNTLHQRVIIAREGSPVDVSPARVVQMLAGGEATPYEITVAEVLLARWAGVPARMGYGYFGGERRGGVLEVHPRQAATWLETYFQGFGWVPLTSIPEQAKGSLGQGGSQANSSVRQSDELTLALYVPVKLDTVRRLYDLVRYWLLMALPYIIALLLLWRFYPAVLKLVRRWRRRRWASDRSLAARIAVSYAELRDVACDLNVGTARATPVEFVEAVDPDDEHCELAWLVTRTIWGDLGRDIRVEDADAAEEMARSVTRRLRKAQSGTAKILAAGSTASLRRPFTPEIPNLWLSPLPDDAAGARRRRRRRRVSAVVVPMVVLALMATAVTAARVLSPSGDRAEAEPLPPPLPSRLVPAAVSSYRFQREAGAEKSFSRAGGTSLVRDGRVFTVREGDTVLAYLQVVALKPGFDADREEVREGILSETGSGQFEVKRRGFDRIYESRLRDQTYRISFSPGGDHFQLMVSKQSFAEAEQLFGALLDYQQGDEAPADLRAAPVLLDPRRGGDGS